MLRPPLATTTRRGAPRGTRPGARPGAALVTGLAAFAVLVAACAGGTGPATADPAGAELVGVPVDAVAAADAICLAAFDEIVALPVAEPGATAPDPEALVAPRLAVYRAMADELRALEVAPHDLARHLGFLERFDAALDTIAADPGAYITAMAHPDAPDPFAPARLLSREIGWRVCGQSEADFGRAAPARHWTTG